jgi:GTPase SAR1 family protein
MGSNLSRTISPSLHNPYYYSYLLHSKSATPFSSSILLYLSPKKKKLERESLSVSVRSGLSISGRPRSGFSLRSVSFFFSLLRIHSQFWKFETSVLSRFLFEFWSFCGYWCPLSFSQETNKIFKISLKKIESFGEKYLKNKKNENCFWEKSLINQGVRKILNFFPLILLIITMVVVMKEKKESEKLFFYPVSCIMLTYAWMHNVTQFMFFLKKLI